MWNRLSSLLRPLSVLAIACSALVPLRAQMDPKLQNGNTDFMDLYQQSSSLKPKPEIATIFDCSDSMNTLMYHPLFPNNDLQDADDYRSMKFVLSNTAASVTNTYTIVASNSNCPATFSTTTGLPNGGSYATYTVTVTSSNGTTATGASKSTSNPVGCYTAPCTTPPNIQILAYAGADSSAQTELVFVPNATGTSYTLSSTYTNTGPQTNSSSANSYTMETSSNGTSGTYPSPGTGSATIQIVSATVSKTNLTPVSSPYPAGSYIVFKVYMAHTMVTEPAEVSTDSQIGWQANLVSSCTGNTAGSISTLTNTASPSGQTSFWVSTAGWTVPTWASNPGTGTGPQQLQAIALATGSSALAPGNTINLTTYLASGTSPATLTWTTVPGTANCSAAQTVTNPVAGDGTNTTTATTTSGGSVSWTVPTTYCNSNTAVYMVTVSLSVAVGANYTAPGVTYLSNTTLSGTTDVAGDSASVLRKPDGSAVTQADADAAKTGSMASPSAPSLAYESLGSADVRNWIRAASHVRLPASVSYKVGTKTYTITRTIDIPIPWNVTDVSTYNTAYAAAGNATLNPLPSTKLLDQETVTSVVNGVTTSTYYGSQPPPATTPSIEIDSTYRVENAANAVFASNAVTSSSGGVLSASAATTVYLYGVVYRPAYINWLYTGTYGSTTGALNNGTAAPFAGVATSSYGSLNYTTDSSLTTAGANYIAYDAINNAYVPNQALASWGQGFGPAGTSWGTITVPTVASNVGVQSGADYSPAPDGSGYRTPSMTRMQAVKNAAIQTWINHQADVYWAFRELDPTGEAGSGTATTINNNSATTITSPNTTTPTTHLNGNDTGWTVLNNTSSQGINAANGNSVNGMARIAYLFANGQTPLTYALARSLAQFEDPNSVFNAVEGSNVSQCSDSFLLLFTDGIDNNGANVNNLNTTTPYITGTGTSAALSINGIGGGNEYVLANQSTINPPTGTNWNLPTLAGIAAHLSDPTMGTINTDYMAQPTASTTNSTGTPSTFLPFAINERGNAANSNTTTFKPVHQVTIMTVGVSLGGTPTTPSGPKQNLFWTAAVGNQAVTTGTISGFHGFNPPTGKYTDNPATNTWVANDWVVNPKDPTDYPTVGMPSSSSVYYFDASNPTTLVSAMGWAFAIALGAGGNNSTASPDLPFIGATLGNEAYMGSFTPPQVGGVIWPGDLMMFDTVNINGTITLVNPTSGAAISTLSTANATWSASASLAAYRYWDTATTPPTGSSNMMVGRQLYTRLPGTSSTPEPGLIPFTYTNTAITNLIQTTATPAARQQMLDAEFAMGANINTATLANNFIANANRDTTMGDIIDSSPAAQEYTWSYVKNQIGTYSPYLGTFTGKGQHFRLIMVGDNQGWMHAFGEVTWTIPDPANSAKTLVQGAVDELWAFMPTDFLPYLDYLTHSTNTHRYMCNGTPSIYFLDLPVSGSGPGNGTVDKGERTIAVFGLGKGGRSYYALNINNPFLPTIQWSLRPDETASFPGARDATGNTTSPFATAILPNMGFSSCTPAFGRVTGGGVFYDAVFLGGGFSVPEIETANFSGTHLGRSVMAVDVNSGHVLAAQDLRASTIGSTTVGPVGASVIPFEFILNSGMAQRAYFLDYYGGLWSWGSKDVASYSPYENFRNDSSEIYANTLTGYHGWQIRKVFQDDNTAASGRGARYTTPPAPFRVGTFPGPAYNGQAVPPAVGIAMVSGDRNNPLDRSYTSTNLIPKWHQLTMVFDRQDSRALGLDNPVGSGTPDTGIQPGISVETSTGSSIASTSSLLVPLNTSPVLTTPTNQCADNVFQAFTQGCTPDTYFLGTSTTPKYGYYVDFPIYDTSAPASTFISKGISPPIVVSGSVSYSYFTPLTSDPCTGGTGNTYSWFIADALHPIVDDLRTGLNTPSGLTMTWNGVASGFMAAGTTTIIQAGMVTGAGGGSTPYVKSTLASTASTYPKARVWRSVQ